MKINARKLLVWLYSSDSKNPLWSSYSELAQLLPDLTQAGLRSLVNLLAKGNKILVERVSGRARIGLTKGGYEELENLFPALSRKRSGWAGQWSCLLFLDAPASDKNFRYLRYLLIKEKAFQLSRGVYLYPDNFPERVLDVCRELYQLSVVVFGLKNWVLGEERKILVEKLQLLDLLENYSGVSNELDSMLGKIKDENELSEKDKKQLFSVFTRLFSIVEIDEGFLEHYFPDENNCKKLLKKLHFLSSL